jgi:DNA-binding FadR family transcriptional regulator
VLSWLVGKGEPDRELLLEIQEVRSIIEPTAAALAAERATKDDRARIKAALAAMEDIARPRQCHRSGQGISSRDPGCHP